MRPLYSLLLVGLSVAAASLSGCQKEDSSLPLNSVKGLVIGTSCNGTLIQLPDGPNVGRTINYNNKEYPNVFGTYSTLSNTPLQPGQTITFSLRKASKVESESRICLAIYSTYDVPQLVIEPPK
ncbi:hypothetical protein SAMN06265337_2318 [Hymenobacter gelipurpurascens]|uniref:Lipoprotein n=1 Tax=Hymenobacter gelipurpurascens TaxID=89968 RepID=A0A212TR17_9BACT|nr:hypothetical protein [Hymenobacter gelipurpurascens]SNC68445.1 hypothetical protein SAMN06265337_2318 [Hymenobacter gelipurpurascens]